MTPVDDWESGQVPTPSGISWQVEHPTGTTLVKGHYLNGEAWIVIPAGQTTVRIASVSPATDYTPGNVRNGSMLNVLGPAHIAVGIGLCGYDDRVGARFNSLLTQPFPVVMSPRDMLVSTISNGPTPNPVCVGGRPFFTLDLSCSNSKIRKAAVLTCLATAPPTDAFRPAYAGNPASRVGLVVPPNVQVDTHYLWGQVNTASLKKLVVPVAPEPSPLLQASELPFLNDHGSPSHRGLSPYFSRVWLDHLGLEINEDEINPTDHMRTSRSTTCRLAPCSGFISAAFQPPIPTARRGMAVQLRGLATSPCYS